LSLGAKERKKGFAAARAPAWWPPPATPWAIGEWVTEMTSSRFAQEVGTAVLF
jgi:hypothetical protein